MYYYRVVGYGFNSRMNLVEPNIPVVFEHEEVAEAYAIKLKRIAQKLHAFYRDRGFKDEEEKAARWREKADKVAAYSNRLWVEQVEVR